MADGKATGDRSELDISERTVKTHLGHSSRNWASPAALKPSRLRPPWLVRLD